MFTTHRGCVDLNHWSYVKSSLKIILKLKPILHLLEKNANLEKCLIHELRFQLNLIPTDNTIFVGLQIEVATN